MKDKVRAITTDEKLKRKMSIMDAALKLYRELPYEDVSINLVAREASIGKGTVYLYFETKEELFISLFGRMLREKAGLIYPLLHRDIEAGRVYGIVDVINAVRLLLGEEPEFLRLLSILNVVLEQNISYEAASEFKGLLHSFIEEVGHMLEELFPSFAPEEGIFFLNQIIFLAIGIHQFSEPSPVVTEVIEKENLEHFEIDFEQYYWDTVRLLLGGYRKK